MNYSSSNKITNLFNKSAELNNSINNVKVSLLDQKLDYRLYHLKNIYYNSTAWLPMTWTSTDGTNTAYAGSTTITLFSYPASIVPDTNVVCFANHLINGTSTDTVWTTGLGETGYQGFIYWYGPNHDSNTFTLYARVTVNHLWPVFTHPPSNDIYTFKLFYSFYNIK